jgi:hypothetical protein
MLEFSTSAAISLRKRAASSAYRLVHRRTDAAPMGAEGLPPWPCPALAIVGSMVAYILLLVFLKRPNILIFIF